MPHSNPNQNNPLTRAKRRTTLPRTLFRTLTLALLFGLLTTIGVLRGTSAPGQGQGQDVAFPTPQPLDTAPTDVITPGSASHSDPGQELAARIRNATPEETVQFSGHLKIRRRSESIRLVPMTFEIIPGEATWKTVYQSETTPDQPGEQWTILHAQGRPNEYYRAIKTPDCDAWPEAQRVTPQEVATAFASSDFWMLDLGMDFLHWPGQRLVKTQMRKGRWCKVLESTPAEPSVRGYSRVLSWLDKETGGPVLAEAYDPENKLIKEFSVGDFRKVNGQWLLEDMKIDNVQTRSRTWIEYDLK